MSDRVGVIGLGQMGRAMLDRLRHQGLEASGYDVLPAASECGSIRELCDGADTLLLSLPSGDAVDEAVGEIASGGASGALVIDTSTDDPHTARRCRDALSEKRISFIDAPVSGGRAGAADGSLSFLVGAEAETLERARPILRALGTNIVHVGSVGAGQAAKLANNFLVALHLVGTREAVALGEAAGVDADALIDALNRCSGRSAVTEINYPRWILNDDFDSGFSAGLMRKDVREAMELARRENVSLPLGESLREIWDADETGDEEDFNRIANPGPKR